MSMRYRLTDYFQAPGVASRGLRVAFVGDIDQSGGGSGVVDHPLGEESRAAPSIGQNLSTNFPYVGGTLTIRRSSDDHEYVSGVDYAEIAPSQWTNLAIPALTSLEITYIIDTSLLYAALTRVIADPLYQSRSEKNQASGYAGLNSLGRLALTQMASGTAVAGKYLDGSGVWTTLPSGGGSSGGGGGGAASYASLVKFGAV